MKKLLFLFVVLFLFQAQAHAKIYILIDEASSKKFPIAVPEFLTMNGNTNQVTKQMTNLVKQDLGITGLFKVLDSIEDKDTSEINFSKWKALEASALLKGLIESKGDNKIQLEVRVYDLQTEKLILGKQYITYEKQTSEAIHRFMDDLLKELTGVKGPFSAPVVASCGPDNSRQITRIAIDGTERKRLTQVRSNNISPNWSPDGKQIAFTSFKSFYPEIFKVSADGGPMVMMTRNQATNIAPSYSPSGASIAFASSRSGDTELYLMSPEGKLMSRLTKVVNIDISPSWSPDGDKLVFASERAGNLHLFMQTLSTGQVARLTYTGYQNDQPDWSPDGKKIVFTSRDRGAFDIFIMNSDGSTIERLTRDEGDNESPSWSPDSRYIVFSSGKRRRQGLYVMTADGDNQIYIPGTQGCVNPDWGPRLK